MRCTPRPASALRYDGQRRDERLALAGLHLGDPAEVQRGAAHELHVEVALAEHPPAGLAHGREGLGQEVVRAGRRRAPRRARGSCASARARSTCCLNSSVRARELLVGEPLDLGLERVDLGHDRLDRLEAPALAGVENLLEQSHAAGESTGGPSGPGPRRLVRVTWSGCVDELLADRVHRGLHAAAQLQLLEDVAHVVLHRVLGDHQLGARCPCSTSRGDEAQHLELAIGEAAAVPCSSSTPPRQRVELDEQLRRHRRRDERLPAGDRADRVGDLLDRDLLQEVAGRARRAPRAKRSSSSSDSVSIRMRIVGLRARGSGARPRSR